MEGTIGCNAGFSPKIMGFNVITHEWNEIEVKGGRPPPRRNHCSCLHGKSDIFFSGGNEETSLQPMREIFHLNCAGGKFVWNQVDWSPLPVARANSIMCCVGHRIYVYGGYPTSGMEQSELLYIYDLRDQAGVELPSSLSHQVHGYRVMGSFQHNTLHAAVATNNKIFVLGGESPSANSVVLLSAAPE